MSDTRTLALIDELLAMPAETALVEFKENNTDIEMIGKRISAMSNAARLLDQPFAYLIWGVRDNDHAPIGTTFEPSSQKHNNQPLEFWLSQHLSPAIAFNFKVLSYREVRLVLLEIPAALSSPVEFDRHAYIRIGSATPRLSDYPERLKALWAKLQSHNWESAVAAQFISGDEVLERLDYSTYFELTRQPLPDNRIGIFTMLEADNLIQADVGGYWNITNLGAILFAKRLSDFSPSLARKAIRELVVNALIHQDMTIKGAGPLVEMFKDRLEITNPGKPLVQPERFLDFPPRSRNEALAALMRRMRLCEEQGTGIDKVIVAVELHQLPPPNFRSEGDAIRIDLYAPRR